MTDTSLPAGATTSTSQAAQAPQTPAVSVSLPSLGSVVPALGAIAVILYTFGLFAWQRELEAFYSLDFSTSWHLASLVSKPDIAIQSVKAFLAPSTALIAIPVFLTTLTGLGAVWGLGSLLYLPLQQSTVAMPLEDRMLGILVGVLFLLIGFLLLLWAWTQHATQNIYAIGLICLVLGIFDLVWARDTNSSIGRYVRGTVVSLGVTPLILLNSRASTTIVLVSIGLLIAGLGGISTRGSRINAFAILVLIGTGLALGAWGATSLTHVFEAPWWIIVVGALCADLGLVGISQAILTYDKQKGFTTRSPSPRWGLLLASSVLIYIASLFPAYYSWPYFYWYITGWYDLPPSVVIQTTMHTTISGQAISHSDGYWYVVRYSCPLHSKTPPRSTIAVVRDGLVADIIMSTTTSQTPSLQCPVSSQSSGNRNISTSQKSSTSSTR